jgi:DNA-binding protein Fis
MNSQKEKTISDKGRPAASETIEGMIEKKIEDLATILCSTGNGKSRLHEDIVSMVEKSLFKIALKRSEHVKTKAAHYLGINRNTFQKKLVKYGMNGQKD